jgi:phosphate transport system substrate-binding protein
MVKTLRLLAVLLGLLLLPAGCDSAATVATPEPTTISVAGATAMRRVLHDLTAAFSRQHPDVLFVVAGGGSTVGEQRVRSGEIDLAASTLFAPAAAADAAGAAGAGAAAAGPGAAGAPPTAGADSLGRVPIGLDGLALVVHPANNVAELSLVQLQAIFGGRVLDWVQVGGDPGEIALVSREDGSGARILFEERVMGAERVSLTAVVMPTSAAVVEYVAKNPAAIGYVSRAEVAEWIEEEAADAEDAANALGAAGAQGAGAPGAQGAAGAAGAEPASTAAPPRVKVLRVEGRLPTRASLARQEYALMQPLYLITDGPPGGWVRQFIDFALSPAGQAIVSRYSAPIR